MPSLLMRSPCKRKSATFSQLARRNYCALSTVTTHCRFTVFRTSWFSRECPQETFSTHQLSAFKIMCTVEPPRGLFYSLRHSLVFTSKRSLSKVRRSTSTSWVRTLSQLCPRSRSTIKTCCLWVSATILCFVLTSGKNRS
jgi:hypothetical protein